MPDEAPETSTVRSALAVRAAVDALMRPGREGGLLTDPVGPVEVVMREAKKLRPDQIDDVVAHLRDAYPATGLAAFLTDGQDTDDAHWSDWKGDADEDDDPADGAASAHVAQGQRPRTGPMPVHDRPQA